MRISVITVFPGYLDPLRESLVLVRHAFGRVDHEEILGKIFSTFCIGK